MCKVKAEEVEVPDDDESYLRNTSGSLVVLPDCLVYRWSSLILYCSRINGLPPMFMASISDPYLAHELSGCPYERVL